MSVYTSIVCTSALWQYAQLPASPAIMSEADPLGLFLLSGAKCS